MRPLKRIRELVQEAVAQGMTDPDDIASYVVEHEKARGINWELWIPFLMKLIELFLTKAPA
jgi:hypothetical protein